MTAKWSQPFSEYFIHHIHPSIGRLGSWNLRPFGLDSATTNQSESFNCVLSPIDAMMLSLYRLSQFQDFEFRRGRCGFGNFTLRDGLQPETDTGLSDLGVVTAADDILQSIRDASVPPPALPSATDGETPSAAPTPSPSASSDPFASSAENDNDGLNLTIYEQANYVINNNKLSLDAKLSIFTVVGSSEPRIVRLFPNTTCSCPSKSGC